MSSASDKSTWVEIITAIKAPLGFYCLTLLLAESFLGIVLATRPNLEPGQTFWVICSVPGMFALVVILVTTILLWKAHVLTFGKEEHMEDRAEQRKTEAEKHDEKFASDKDMWVQELKQWEDYRKDPDALSPPKTIPDGDRDSFIEGRMNWLRQKIANAESN